MMDLHSSPTALPSATKAALVKNSLQRFSVDLLHLVVNGNKCWKTDRTSETDRDIGVYIF